MQGISSVASRNNPVKYTDTDGEKMGMPENLTKEMHNRLSCTHAMPTVDFSGLKENLFLYWYQGCLEEK